MLAHVAVFVEPSSLTHLLTFRVVLTFNRYKPTHVLHLAAQAGVRYNTGHCLGWLAADMPPLYVHASDIPRATQWTMLATICCALFACCR